MVVPMIITVFLDRVVWQTDMKVSEEKPITLLVEEVAPISQTRTCLGEKVLVKSQRDVNQRMTVLARPSSKLTGRPSFIFRMEEKAEAAHVGVYLTDQIAKTVII
jgi:hypothetical protein